MSKSFDVAQFKHSLQSDGSDSAWRSGYPDGRLTKSTEIESEILDL